MRRRFESWGVTGCVFACSACGADAASPTLDGSAETGGTASGADAGETTGGGDNGGGGQMGSGGWAGSGGTSGGGDGRAGVDCVGEFRDPELLFSIAPPMDLGGPSVTGDELELFYSLDDGSGVAQFVVSVRQARSEPFPPAIPVAGLPGCTTPFGTMDVSDDGLRLYHGCWSDPAELVNVLVTERPARGAPFGAARMVARMGASPSVDASELTVFSSGLSGGTPLQARRLSMADGFGDSGPIPGLEASGLLAPDPSSNGLLLFGAEGGQLGYYTRTAETTPFRQFNAIAGVPASSGAPALSADCRTLYFVARGADGARGVYVVQR